MGGDFQHVRLSLQRFAKKRKLSKSRPLLAVRARVNQLLTVTPGDTGP